MLNQLTYKTGTLIFAMIFGVAQTVLAESENFGDPDDVAFAEKLWHEMEGLKLVGDAQKPDNPYKGTHPHGAILETLNVSLSIDGFEGEVLVKRNYGGAGVSIAEVSNDRSKYIKDVTVMFKREQGYDDDNQNWFWAKFEPDGSLDANPRGRKLAGRVAKGKSKGCIACHQSAPGGDYLFVK